MVRKNLLGFVYRYSSSQLVSLFVIGLWLYGIATSIICLFSLFSFFGLFSLFCLFKLSNLGFPWNLVFGFWNLVLACAKMYVFRN